LDAPAAARLSGANTKVGGRFGMKRCGPSCRHTRNASAVFKIFVLHPKKTFATKSANGGHAGADLEQGINKRSYERPADALSSGSMSDLAEVAQ
jgi:hypothetical protein